MGLMHVIQLPVAVQLNTFLNVKGVLDYPISVWCICNILRYLFVNLARPSFVELQIIVTPKRFGAKNIFFFL